METPEYGMEKLDGKRLTEVRRDAEFEDPLKLLTSYSTLVAVKGRTKLEEREAFELLAKYPDGVSETLFFGAGTGCCSVANRRKLRGMAAHAACACTTKTTPTPAAFSWRARCGM